MLREKEKEIGKWTRSSRAWLYSNLKGKECGLTSSPTVGHVHTTILPISLTAIGFHGFSDFFFHVFYLLHCLISIRSHARQVLLSPSDKEAEAQGNLNCPGSSKGGVGLDWVAEPEIEAIFPLLL